MSNRGTINQRRPVYAGFVLSIKRDDRVKRTSLRYDDVPWDEVKTACEVQTDVELTVVGQTQRSMRLEGTGVVAVARKVWTDDGERVVAPSEPLPPSDPVPSRAMVERALVVLVETLHGQVWASDMVRLYLAGDHARIEKPIRRCMDKMMRALGHEPTKANSQP